MYSAVALPVCIGRGSLVAGSPNGEVGGVGLRHSPQRVLAERAWRRRRELRLSRTLFGSLRRRLSYRHSRKLRNQTGHGRSMLRNAHRHLRRSCQRQVSLRMRLHLRDDVASEVCPQHHAVVHSGLPHRKWTQTGRPFAPWRRGRTRGVSITGTGGGLCCWCTAKVLYPALGCRLCHPCSAAARSDDSRSFGYGNPLGEGLCVPDGWRRRRESGTASGSSGTGICKHRPQSSALGRLPR